jgi:hypothetical protein
MPATPSAAKKLPNSATPMAPPAWRTVLSTPEATPERARGTADSTAIVIDGTTSPRPPEDRSSPGSIAT